MKNQSKKAYNSRLMLIQKNPWLGKRPDALDDLLDSCEGQAESHLIRELLNRFFFLYQVDTDHGWQQMVYQIFKVWKLDQKNTQIVALAKDDNADSSQAVLYMLKPAIRKLTGKNITSKITIDASIKLAEKKPYLVIVDDFIGSGDTVKENIKYLKEKISSKVNIYICVVAAMEDSLANIEGIVDEVFAVHYLKKGISGYYKPPELTERLDVMLNMESQLKYNPSNKCFPFGYKKSEALYGIDGWNAVNNLFPLFWWETLKDGKKRNPLLVRASDVED